MDVLSYVFVIAACCGGSARRRRQRAVGELPGRVPRRPALYAGQQDCTACCCAPPCSSCSPARVGLAAAGGAPDAGRILGLLRRAAGRGGAGAILGALLLPRLGKLDADGLVLLASVASAAVMAALVFAPPVAGRAAAGRAGHGLDHGAHHLQQRGPGHPAQLGARPWPGGVPDRVQRRHGGGQPGLGPGGARNRRALRAGGQRRRPGPGRAAVHRVRLPVGEADLQASNHWPEPLVPSRWRTIAARCWCRWSTASVRPTAPPSWPP